MLILFLLYFQEHLEHYVKKIQDKNHRINISSIYGGTHRKFAPSFLNAYILSLHISFQHNEKLEFVYFNHKIFPNNSFPLYVEVKDDVDDIVRNVEIKKTIKGKIQDEVEIFSVRLWKLETIPVDYVKTIQINRKRIRILSTEHYVPSWLK